MLLPITNENGGLLLSLSVARIMLTVYINDKKLLYKKISRRTTHALVLAGYNLFHAHILMNNHQAASMLQQM